MKTITIKKEEEDNLFFILNQFIITYKDSNIIYKKDIILAKRLLEDLK